MTDREYKKEKRKQNQLARLQSNNPKCAFCPENDSCYVDWHHPLHKTHFQQIQFRTCSNHHRKLHDLERDHDKLPELDEMRTTSILLLRLFADCFRILQPDAEEFIEFIEQIAGCLSKEPHQ
jgi:hypothetical protein